MHKLTSVTVASSHLLQPSRYLPLLDHAEHFYSSLNPRIIPVLPSFQTSRDFLLLTRPNPESTA